MDRFLSSLTILLLLSSQAFAGPPFRTADPEFGAIETLYGAGYSFSDG